MSPRRKRASVVRKAGDDGMLGVELISPSVTRQDGVLFWFLVEFCFEGFVDG